MQTSRVIVVINRLFHRRALSVCFVPTSTYARHVKEIACIITTPRIHSSKYVVHDLTFAQLATGDVLAGTLTTVNRTSLVHSGFACAFCNMSPIVGVRYLCTQCGLDLCEACELLEKHPPTHTRLKIAYPAPRE
eukprot:TRINITY_DN2128_c0_g1_i1.p1 TRINITY_DN2128_c0_g1~~TRINITY_DN2128_c0_g1_i1.p1  ORF type:complete len:134 (+),score=3.74 TRINITY_DN2128_c0_g1_i1:158-559(+)